MRRKARPLRSLIAVLLNTSALLAQQSSVVVKNEPTQPALAASAQVRGGDGFSERNPRYKVAHGDVLLISFPLSPELNQKVAVQPDGYIALQSAGTIYVEGLTLSGVAEAAKKAYAHILHDPIIDVDLADFQKPSFTVWGQVGKPGKYELRDDTTVTEGIAIAGGLEATAKTQVFLYHAVSSNWAEVHEIKLKDILHGKNIGEDVHLQPGDMIFVPEKTIANFRKYVPYSVGLAPPYPSTY